METPVITESPANAYNSHGRDAHPVELVVVHDMEGMTGPTLRLFAQPVGKSAHFCIDGAGAIFQCVELDRVAFHAGNYDFNARSVGIELEGWCTAPELQQQHVGAPFPTDAQIHALAQLIVWLAGKYPAIQLDRQHVIGHYEVPDERHPGLFGGVSHHTDPGQSFPWDALFCAITALSS